MAQAPATPKLKRWTTLWAARMGRKPAELQPSEEAAFAMRASLPPRLLPDHVRFLIPLVGPEAVGDWTAVERRLMATLESLRAQTNPNWRAVICCQTRPTLPDDPRLRHLPFTDAAPGNDKWRKLGALYDDLAQTCPSPAYVMSFDADDLAHRDTVSEMLTRQDPSGYLVTHGYVMDHATGQIALAAPQSLQRPMQKAFWKLCGSCAALRHDPQNPASARFLKEMTAHEHRMFPYLAHLARRSLQPLSRPRVLYILNHGENFGARRGRVSFKRRFVQRFALPPDAARALLQSGDFTPPKS